MDRTCCNPKPILVTGSHRCGSTWVSKILALAKGVAFIDEILNIEKGLLRKKQLFRYWFPYITEETKKQEYIEAIRDIMNLNPAKNIPEFIHLVGSFYSHSRPIMKNMGIFAHLVYSLFDYSRPLVKDPIAVFSSEWLAAQFNMEVVMLIRHPAAFVNSLKRLNWRFDFTHFLEQKRLMAEHLAPYSEKMSRGTTDIVEEASLLWLCIYSVVDTYIQRHPEWIVRRHEDISFNPTGEFRDIYQRLGLRWTKDIERQIIRLSSPSNPAEAPKNLIHYQLRDSKTTAKAWKQRLSDDEIERIRDVVEPLSSRFYDQSDW